MAPAARHLLRAKDLADARYAEPLTVAFNDPPTPQSSGIDTSFRDLSGNKVRLTQVLDPSPDRP